MGTKMKNPKKKWNTVGIKKSKYPGRLKSESAYKTPIAKPSGKPGVVEETLEDLNKRLKKLRKDLTELDVKGPATPGVLTREEATRAIDYMINKIYDLTIGRVDKYNLADKLGVRAGKTKRNYQMIEDAYSLGNKSKEEIEKEGL